MPIASRLTRPMVHALAQAWWLLLLRGIAAVIFGILTFTWPGLTLIVLVLLYGAFALADGLLCFLAAFASTPKLASNWWLVLIGVLGIVAGGLTFIWPGITALVLVTLIGAWSLVRGIFEILGAIELRKEISNEWMLISSGVISVIFGLILLIAPGPGAVGLVWAIAAYAVMMGIFLIALSLHLRRHAYLLALRRGALKDATIKLQT